jgi:hypothetical protein
VDSVHLSESRAQWRDVLNTTWTVVIHILQGISWITEALLASQESFCSLDLFRYMLTSCSWLWVHCHRRMRWNVTFCNTIRLFCMSRGRKVRPFFEIILKCSVYQFRNVCIVYLAFNCLESRKFFRENTCNTDACFIFVYFLSKHFSSDYR